MQQLSWESLESPPRRALVRPASYITIRRSRLLACIWVSAALLCTACGGGGGGGGGGGSDPTRRDLEVPIRPPVNRAPTITAAERSERVVIGHPVSIDVLEGGPIFSDPDGDPLTIEVRWGVWNASDGPLTWGGLTLDDSRLEGTAASTGANHVVIEASDGRGGSAQYKIEIVVSHNAVPIPSAPNANRIVNVGQYIEFDAIAEHTVFTDPDGDEMTYEVAFVPTADQFQVHGTLIGGHLSKIGAVRVVVTATDPYGGTGTDTFLIAAPAPEPGRPDLPSPSYVYDDTLLDWPESFRQSRDTDVPFRDTTPPDNPTTNAGATLGRVLFYDKRLSITNTHSCGSCHEQQRGFTIGERFAVGVTGELTKRNPMSLANVRYNLRNAYFGDARVIGLEALAPMPIQDPIELGNDLPDVIEKLSRTDFYPPLFEAAFGSEEITESRIARALAQFLRSIVSYRSKFDLAFNDAYPLAPNPAAVLTAEELLGRDVFVKGSCGFCHTHGTHENNLVSNNGLDAEFTDPGAGDGEFRASSLRNIAVSGPYMHDGRFATLREVIDHYDSGVKASLQLHFLLRDHQSAGSEQPSRLGMTEEEKLALEAFLNTLTDDALLNDPKFSDPFQ